MRRYLSTRRNSLALSEKTIPEESQTGDRTSLAEDASSTAALVAPLTPMVPCHTKVKRVDHYWSNWSKAWKYKNSGFGIIAEAGPAPGSSGNTKDDPWAQYCFVVIRKLPKSEDDGEPTFNVVLKSPYLIQGCKHVIQDVPGVSWNSVPLQVSYLLIRRGREINH